jgi:hypothetical protein
MGSFAAASRVNLTIPVRITRPLYDSLPGVPVAGLLYQLPLSRNGR